MLSYAHYSLYFRLKFNIVIIHIIIVSVDFFFLAEPTAMINRGDYVQYECTLLGYEPHLHY
ncbi:hypothetical protein XSR1_240048 [Xenorhabdus szentirmaii DSM 16338]|uniref:Uncharacterized protein n=1 Tax=Xenorhabdus szentirmaii DSM 16338 TaxID=1427518 RepID=W1IWC5_9GAMM|nr:hypothetical protein XSR1_240048 [Xenorhabdus szentirmaii DSM 16338]